MRVTITRAAGVAIILTVCTSASAGADRHHRASARRQLPNLAYIIHGTLWLRSLPGGSASSVPTPWPLSGLTWSPDGRAIAFQGKHGLGVVALHGSTARTVFTRRLNNLGENLTWSPNGRYLLFSVPVRRLPLANLWLWDRSTGQARLLLHGASADFPAASWAHDSTHLAIARGPVTPSMSTTQPNPRAAILDVRSGHLLSLGRGVPGDWSPDDRFLGIDHLLVCGATGCIEREGVMPSSGGPVTVLARSIRGGWRTDEVWVPRHPGYAYDHWLLGPHGHVQRPLPGRFDRVESWSPDGRWVAVRSLTATRRIVLTLIDANSGRSIQLYVSGRTSDCDFCVNQGYQLAWNRTGSAFALLTPFVCCPPDNRINPSLSLYTLSPRRLSPAISMRQQYPTMLGWVNHDRAVIVYADHTLFLYVPGSSRLIPLVRGLPSAANSLGLSEGSPAALRPS